MSTRATIRFKDEYDEYFVYRHSDGFPEIILPHLQELIDKSRGRWSGSELGTMVAFFFGLRFDINKRLPDYDLTASFHGDESYQYYFDWNVAEKQWVIKYE